MTNLKVQGADTNRVIGSESVCPSICLAICYFDANANLLDSVYSALSLGLSNTHILVIDAISTAKASIDSEIHSDSVELLDISHINFANLAQLKNHVVNCIESEYICFINAGWKLTREKITNLFNSPITDSIESFKDILTTNVSSIGLLAYKTDLLKDFKFNKAIYSGEDFELILRLLVTDMKSSEGIINEDIFYLESEDYNFNPSISFFDTLAYCLGKYSNILNSLSIYEEISDYYTEIAKTNNYKVKFEEKLCNYLTLENNYELGENIFLAASAYYYNNETAKATNLLTKYFWHENEITRTASLTEKNMLLYIMAEIASIFTSEELKTAFLNKYPTLRSFKKDYLLVKFALRRIWFKKDCLDKDYLLRLLITRDIPVEMLTVITKYASSQNYSLELFENVAKQLGSSKLDRLYFNKFDCFKTILEKDLKERQISQYSIKERLDNQTDSSINSRIFYTELDLTRDSFTQSGPDSSTNTLQLHPKKDLDLEKIAIIFCTNNEVYKEECLFYLKDLKLPEGFSLEIIAIKNASSMTEGYNFAMSHTNAKFILYIHHDTFLIDRDILIKLVTAFKKDSNIGMLGVFGSASLDGSCKWYKSPIDDNYFNLYQDEILDVLTSVKRPEAGKIAEALAIDGVFMATSVDIPWDKDCFNDWHFYDIAQCFKMREAGLKIGFLGTDSICLLHENSLNKDPDFKYELYASLFKNTYY